MSKGLQQRIVGALVLGALGLIILPVLFDFTAPSRIDRSTKLPAAPEISAVTVIKAERPAVVTSGVLDNAIFDVSKLIVATADEAPIRIPLLVCEQRAAVQHAVLRTLARADHLADVIWPRDVRLVHCDRVVHTHCEHAFPVLREGHLAHASRVEALDAGQGHEVSS